MTDLQQEMAETRQRVDRYNRWLLLIAAVTAALLVLIGAFTMWRVLQIASATREQVRLNTLSQQDLRQLIGEQTRQGQAADARTRSAVETLLRAQQRSLDAHDEKVRQRLQQLADAIGRLEQPPQQVILTTSTTTAAAPSPVPQPRPTPTCHRLPNGRCRH